MSGSKGAAAAYRRMASAMKDRMDEAAASGQTVLAAAFEKKYRELVDLARSHEDAAA